MGLPTTGFHVPRWFLGALLAGAALLSAGFAAGQKTMANDRRIEDLDYRTCRIERALGIDPWPSCPSTPSGKGR